MRIYSMTATFGKLENETLELQPGLNILSRPNEWGKSTWCAFLVAMLYGLETRQKDPKTGMTPKNYYTPWSGKPMAGRIHLHWQGRDITIERWSTPRTAMGEFRAYETDTGLEVAELTATNCGEKLLRVEKSVFLRSGFLQLADLPVTADDALRRRLNALVTTGDESDTADQLGKQLKQLKNDCRSNRSNGLIPKAEGEKAVLEGKLSEMRSLREQLMQLRLRKQYLEEQIAALENHNAALSYQAAQKNLRHVTQAEEAVRFAQLQVNTLEAQCQNLPTREAAQQKLHQLQDLRQKQQNARMDAQMLPAAPQEPKAPMCFYGLSGQQALEQVHADISEYRSLEAANKRPFPLWILGIIAAVVGIVLLVLKLWIPGALLLSAGAGLLFTQSMLSHRQNQSELTRISRQQAIISRYGGGAPEDWLAEAQRYNLQRQEYAAALQTYEVRRQDTMETVARLDKALEDATEGMGLSAATEHYLAVIRQQDALFEAHQQLQQAENHAETLRSVAKPAEKPDREDSLTHSPEETAQLLSNASYELKQLQLRLGQYQGRMDALGEEDALQQELDAVNTRLEKLYRTNQALELSLQTLQNATCQLQRRFAPKIASQSCDLLERLTGGRYDRLSLSEDLSVNTATAQEVSSRPIRQRSDGTVDQLYLALRLAVARELTPDAPLILDDALVRFDDKRHAAAMDILQEEAADKQIILFTCQARETRA